MVCVKDRTCLRMAIPTYCLCIFGSIFGDLYFLLIKKVNIIRVWHYLTKYEKVSMSSLKCECISSYGQRKLFLFWKLYIGMVWIFIPFHQTWRFELKNFWKFNCFNFTGRKGINFGRVQMIYMIYVHPLTLYYPRLYAKKLSNIIAR